MALIKSGGLGKMRGKVNDVVAASWKNLYVARSTPRKTTKKPSAATLVRRDRFGMVSHELQQFYDAIQIGYPSNRTSSTNMNVAIKSAMKNAVEGAHPDLYLDFKQIQLSKGALSQVYNAKGQIDAENPRMFNVAWQNPQILKLGLSAFDSIQIFTLSALQDETIPVLYENAAYRSDSACSIDLGQWTRLSVDVWMFLLSEDGKKASPTKYLGKFTF